MIMQRPLSEIDLTSHDVSERLITLDCGHIFTVETLDGHCHMTDYYEVDMMGDYLAPAAPPISYQMPPTCPTCRGPISALRYGRVTKRANLDILEQNVASNMSKSLDDLSPMIVTISAEVTTSEDSAKKLKYEPAFKGLDEFDDLVARRNEKLEGKIDEPLPSHIFDQGAMKSVHGFAPQEAREWNLIVKGLLRTYGRVATVAKTRSAHVRAYEAALTTLYHMELEEMASDPERATERPEPIAIEAVRRKIGQPPHKADRRFHVEAFMLSIEIRFTLGQIARARFGALPVTSNDPLVLHHRLLWSSFVEFIYESCIVDCRKTIGIADRSSASRQTARAAIMQIQSEFEGFRFDMINRREQMALKCEPEKWDATRKELLMEIRGEKADSKLFLENVMKSYLRSRPTNDMKELLEERAWFAEHCDGRAQRVLKEYDSLSEYVTKGGLYQPMTLQEREDIVKAFGFCEFTSVSPQPSS